MYLDFYGFRQKPFNLVADPGFLYMSSKHRLALTYLEYGLMDGIGFVLLTGEIGIGKTTLIRKLLSQVEKEVEIAVVFNTNVTSEQLLELILQEFEVETRSRRKAAHLDTLNQFLINKYGEGRRAVLIVDEAQNLSWSALEEVRMLSNLQTDQEPLLQIVLVGQPALRIKLQDSSLAQLSQRIAVSYHLSSLSFPEVKEYIAHRLQKAGAGEGEIFDLEAMKSIFDHSKGIPRAINIICDAALVYGYADELTCVGKQVIEQVIRDKSDVGLVPTGVIQAEGLLPTESSRDNGHVLARLQNLEEKVSKLSGLVDCRVHTEEERAEKYKDRLIQNLERMLAQERKRNDKLVEMYQEMRFRLRSKTSEVKKE
jgi:putative secretion ATPase (PEP-CTERM system associated)